MSDASFNAHHQNVTYCSKAVGLAGCFNFGGTGVRSRIGIGHIDVGHVEKNAKRSVGRKS